MPVFAYSQYYDTGQDPAGLKWLQIKTDRFRIIYPEKYGSEGLKFAGALDKAYADLGALFPQKKFRLPVIIHNFTTQANGYVAWAPKRLEIYPTPEQNTIPLDEKRQLALHEITHVMQMESVNSGFTRAVSFILGQQFTGIVSSLLPLWYLEGDAVFSETILSESGRGKSAGFQKQLKAIVIEKGKPFKFDKAINDSYRDYIPDHYQFGYQMVAYARTRDMEIWNKTIRKTSSLPFILNPVNLSLWQNQKLTKKKLYYQAFDTLKTLWGNDLKSSGARKYEPLIPSPQKKFLNYCSPVLAGKDSVIAIKTSLHAPPKFVIIGLADKSEKTLLTPGSMYPYFLSCGGGKIVWVETRPDPRWENREYSVVRIMDLKNGGIRRLSRKSRFMAASISGDGKLIAVSENSIDNKNSLILISPENGHQIKKIPAPGNASLQRPQWSSDNKSITFISLSAEGEGIILYNMENDSWKTLLEAGRDDLQSSFIRNDSLFFITSATGTDNIRLLTPDKRIITISNSRFGTNDLSVYGSDIYFSDYTSDGNKICRISLKEASDYNVEPARSSYFSDRFNIEINDEENGPGKNYYPQPYRKWQHLFGVHSWMPFYADIDEIKSDPAAIRPGAAIMTQNHLSTLIATAGYEYSEKHLHMLHSSISWRGWYPVFESAFDYGDMPMIYNARANGTGVPPPATVNRGVRFTNTVYFPLSFSTGRFSQYLYLGGSSAYYNNYLYNIESSSYSSGITQFSGRLYFTNYFRKAWRDLYPRWSQSIDFIYSWYPFESSYFGSLITLKGAFWFPGLLRNNSLRIRIEAEKQSVPFKYYHQGSRISFSRSYSDIIPGEAQFISADYYMPLAYPDLNISSILYLKRIRTGMFYDYTRGTGNYIIKYDGGSYKTEYHDYTETFRSFGIELLADFHLLRIPYMISSGIQTTLRSFDEKPYFRFILNMDIYGMSIGRRQRI